MGRYVGTEQLTASARCSDGRTGYGTWAHGTCRMFERHNTQPAQRCRSCCSPRPPQAPSQSCAACLTPKKATTWGWRSRCRLTASWRNDCWASRLRPRSISCGAMRERLGSRQGECAKQCTATAWTGRATLRPEEKRPCSQGSAHCRLTELGCPASYLRSYHLPAIDGFDHPAAVESMAGGQGRVGEGRVVAQES